MLGSSAACLPITKMTSKDPTNSCPSVSKLALSLLRFSSDFETTKIMCFVEILQIPDFGGERTSLIFVWIFPGERYFVGNVSPGVSPENESRYADLSPGNE